MRLLALAGAVAVMAVSAAAAAPQSFRSSAGNLSVETFASGLVHPWALAFLPDGRMLVTVRPGRLRIVGKDGKLSAALPGMPRVSARGQAGLLDQLVLNLGIRNDGFSTFGSANPRANYPKASAAWTFSNLLNGRDRSGLLSYGKLHVAYGETGKEPPAYAAITALTSTTFIGLGGFGDVLSPHRTCIRSGGRGCRPPPRRPARSR